MVGCGVNAFQEMPHVTRSVSQSDGMRTITINTPDGDLTATESFDPYTHSWHPGKYMVESAEDLATARWLFRDTRYKVDRAKADRSASRQRELVEQDVVTYDGVGPTPLMDMIEHVCGPESTVYLLYDEPDLFREVIDLMQADRMRQLRARGPHMVADTVWMIENTSTTLISPALFQEFCGPHLAEYGNAILDLDRVPVHHMCGTLNALLESVDALPALVNEAFTTRPLGDVSLAEGRKRMPSKALIGGTNATLWLDPVETIVETVAEDLAACPDRRKVFLTSAGVLPAPVSFEKARRVVEEFKRL